MWLVLCVTKQTKPPLVSVDAPIFANWLEYEGLWVMAAVVENNWQQQFTAVDHHHFLCALHQQLSIIPMRYGSLAADRSSLERWLILSSVEFHRWFAQMPGVVEMALLTPDSSNSDKYQKTQEQGTDYLHSQRQKYIACRNRTSLISIRTTLAGSYRRCIVESSASQEKPIMAVRLLVSQENLQSFQQGCSTLLLQYPDWIACGPWPPYSFVGNAFTNTKQ